MSEHDDATSASNRREDARHEWHHRINLAWVGDGSMGHLPIKTAKAENISISGLAIRTQNMVHPGQFGVVLLGRGEHQTLVRGIEVLHCHYDEVSHNHVVGCCWAPIPEFVRAVAEEHKGKDSLSVTVEENGPRRGESWHDVEAVESVAPDPKREQQTKADRRIEGRSGSHADRGGRERSQ